MGMQMRPRPCVAMKLTISGVTRSAETMKSPSFSRSASSTTTTILPSRMSATASSMVANIGLLPPALGRLGRGTLGGRSLRARNRALGGRLLSTVVRSRTRLGSRRRYGRRMCDGTHQRRFGELRARDVRALLRLFFEDREGRARRSRRHMPLDIFGDHVDLYVHRCALSLAAERRDGDRVRDQGDAETVAVDGDDGQAHAVQ